MAFLKNPRIQYEVKTPDGVVEPRTGYITGYVTDAAKIKALLLHTYPPGTTIENLRQIDTETGEELAEQPDVFKTPEQLTESRKRAAAERAARVKAATPAPARVTTENQ
jgi:hypothetical protein